MSFANVTFKADSATDHDGNFPGCPKQDLERSRYVKDLGPSHQSWLYL